MKKAIQATLKYKCSTNKNSENKTIAVLQVLNPGVNGKTEANGTLDSFEHDDLLLNDAVVKRINEDLTRDDLLQRCLGTKTIMNH